MNRIFLIASILFFTLSALSVEILLAHQGIKHVETKIEPKSDEAIAAPNRKGYEVTQLINESYLKTIKPIFQRSCFNCHSDQTTYPWYYALPLINWLIDRDIREARKHLDMSRDFPFTGHGSVEEDLQALQEDIEENEMPPFRYFLLHWDARLAQKEKEDILNWIEASRNILQSGP